MNDGEYSNMGEYSDMNTAHPMWGLAAVQAARQGHAKGLHRPPGYEGLAYTLHRFCRPDGSIYWSLSYRFGRDGKQKTIASWITDWLPEEMPKKCRQTIAPPTEPIRIKSCGCDFHARVVLDNLGLPVPVPVGAKL
jgi:hypothetical protein